MTTIKAKVNGAAISVEMSGDLTSGMVGVPVSFEFDSAWDGLIKTAVFRAGKVSKDRIDVAAETTVPWEVITQKNYKLEIGIYGCNAEGTVVIPTVWAAAGQIYPGADPSGDPSTDPSLPVWQQLLNKLDSGELQGPQGPKGDKGDPGKDGADGYTPKKGVDYYTPAEKEKLVAEIAAGFTGDIEAALDHIIAIQEELIGGSSGGDSTDTTYFCSACGAEITTDTAQVGYCSECSARCIVCPDCGAIHASEGPYECVNCGRDLEELV